MTTNTFAQSGTSSPYSFFGVGIEKFKGTAENRAMGGLGIYGDSIHLNLQNPAAYGGLKLTTYSFGATYNTKTISNGIEEETADVAAVDYLSIGIPAGKKIGFGFGLLPKSAVGYEIENVENGVTSLFSGSGGINKVYLSAGYEVIKGLNVGVDVNYNFGTIETKAVERGNTQRATREVNKSTASGFAYSFGAIYKKSIKDIYELTVSATIAPSSKLRLDNSRDLSLIDILTDGRERAIETQSITVADETLDFDTGYSFGVGFGQPKKWFVGAEYELSSTSALANRSFQVTNVSITDATRMSFGGFYIPKYNSLTSYFKRVVYRAGVRFEENGINVNGQAIDEFGISFGLGLPIGSLFSNANISFEYGQRGTTIAGLVEEDFFNISIGLSLNDKWFRKIKYN